MLTKFKPGMNPEKFWKLFTISFRCVSNITPLHALSLALAEHEEALNWVTSEPVCSNADISLKELADLFAERFIDRGTSPADAAHEELMSCKVRMDPKKGVAEYAARFRDYCARANLTDQRTMKLLFRRGLNPDLWGRCRVNSAGLEFGTLKELITHAEGQEKALKAEKKPSDLNYAERPRFANKRRPPSSRAPGSTASAPKKPRFADVAAAAAAAADPAGPSTSGRAPRPAPPPLPPPPPPSDSKRMQPPNNPGRVSRVKTAGGRFLTLGELYEIKSKGLCRFCRQHGHLGDNCPFFDTDGRPKGGKA
ncbi:hypothetical protein GPECTOR_135g624 [Gonium pectorale]|uniref:Retrotransposon gag domain-containing protein n=1 Tax=Gonium pectorale TaxID=33097 RepID=A0A150FZR4_GONPE|nr:hypothetical protein GPECTOR_135g624 [Gonium pectorale]|eukprot:KXZ42560.1 hypothetical protein GPECTOR_135g624 [Gonium pectorale]